MNARTKNALGGLWDALSSQFQPRPVTATAVITDYTADAEGRVLSYQADVQEPGGVIRHTLTAGSGPSYGRGTIVTVFRDGDNFTGGWRLADGVSGYGTQVPAIYGGITSIEPSLITGLGFHIPKGDGCFIVGGTLVRDTDPPHVTGTRVRICANGIKGLGRDGTQMAFMLATEDHTTYENNEPVDIGEGDAQLGYRDTGHLYVDSSGGSLTWSVGDQVLWQSKMVDDLPYTQMAGLLRLSDYYVGEGIELGKDHRGAHVLQLLNRYNVPLIVMRAGYEGDPDRGYLRIGPPPPAGGITATSVDGVPTLIVDGEIVQNLPAGSMNVNQLSDITSNQGVIRTGRAEFLQPGTSFTHWGDFGDASGVVIGYDDQTSAGRMLGLEGGVINTEVDSLGQIRWAGGRGTLNLDGLDYTYNTTNFVRINDNAVPAWLYINADEDNGGPQVGLGIQNAGTDIYDHAIAVTAAAGNGINVTTFGGLTGNFILQDGVTNTYSPMAVWAHLSTGTPAANFALRHLFQLQSSTDTYQDAAAFDVLWTTATHASRTAAIRWSLVNNAGALAEFMKLTPTELELQGNLKVQGKPVFDPGATLTISGGAITVTAGFHFVDTQDGDASDELDTINGGVDGMILVLRANTSTRTVVCKDGTGNMQLAGDMSLDNTQDSITLMFYSSGWFEISRSDNGA